MKTSCISEDFWMIATISICMVAKTSEWAGLQFFVDEHTLVEVPTLRCGMCRRRRAGRKWLEYVIFETMCEVEAKQEGSSVEEISVVWHGEATLMRKS